MVQVDDYELMARFLEFGECWRMGPLVLGLKEAMGRNACDLAIEMGR